MPDIINAEVKDIEAGEEGWNPDIVITSRKRSSSCFVIFVILLLSAFMTMISMGDNKASEDIENGWWLIGGIFMFCILLLIGYVAKRKAKKIEETKEKCLEGVLCEEGGLFPGFGLFLFFALIAMAVIVVVFTPLAALGWLP